MPPSPDCRISAVSTGAKTPCVGSGESGWRVETLEFEYHLVDAGDRVVMLLEQRMRGRSTGIEVSLGKYAQVATFRDGLIFRWKLYLSQAEALKPAGLRE